MEHTESFADWMTDRGWTYYVPSLITGLSWQEAYEFLRDQGYGQDYSEAVVEAAWILGQVYTTARSFLVTLDYDDTFTITKGR